MCIRKTFYILITLRSYPYWLLWFSFCCYDKIFWLKSIYGRKVLFCLQFQITVHHYRKFKGGIWSTLIHSQEQGENPPAYPPVLNPISKLRQSRTEQFQGIVLCQWANLSTSVNVAKTTPYKHAHRPTLSGQFLIVIFFPKDWRMHKVDNCLDPY